MNAIKREEQIGDCRLLLGDCLEILAELEPVDAVVTDPVWPNNCIPEFDKYSAQELISLAFQSLQGNAKRAAIHLGCDSDPASMLQSIGMPFFRVCWLRYSRPHYKGRLLYGADVAYLYGDPPPSRKGAQVIPGEVCKTESRGRETTHPCERSEQHVRWLVEKWSASGETLLDPFMGSGTTGVACAKMDRRFIGIEIDEGYFDIACRRIEDAYRQGKLAL